MSSNVEGIDSKWLIMLLKKNFHLNEPQDIEDVRIEPAVPVGENFMSSVFRVKVLARLLNGRRKKMSIIVKYFPSTGPIVDVLSPYDTVRNEVKIYNALPLFDDLMEEFDDKREKLWCNTYGQLPYSTIALEDIQVYGYETMDRKQWQPVEHTTLVLREIGRFHAMTKVLLGRGLISKEDSGSHFICTDTPAFRVFMPGCLQVLSSAIEQSWDPQWRGLASKVKKEIPLVCDKLYHLMRTYDPRFEVLNHGDIWTNNLMWKFTEHERIPISVKFIDFQFPIVYSFVWDIAYHMYCCMKPSTRRDNWDSLLRAYQSSLEKNLKFFNWEGYIPTLDDVYSEFDRISYAVFACIIYSRPVQSGSCKVTYDLANVLTKSPFEFLDKSIYTEDKYAKEVCVDLQLLADKGVI